MSSYGATMEKEKAIKNIDFLKAGDHSVLFYEEEEDIIAAAVAFIKKTLSADQKCLYIDERENHKIVSDKLRNQINSFDSYLRSGQLQLLTKEEAYGNPSEFKAVDMINLIKEKVIQAGKENYQGLSITGELKGIIDFKGGKEEIIKYEWQLNDQIFSQYPVTALCRYNLNKFDNQVIKAAVELHNYIIWQGELHQNPYYIDPEGYKTNKIEEYEIKSWLKNINKYQSKENMFKRAISQSQKKYFRLYNNAPIGIIKTTSEGRVIHINKRMAEIAGYDNVLDAINNYDNLAGQFYVKPERRADFLIRLKNEGEVENFEFEARKKNGEHIWLNMNAQITERKADGTFIIEGFVFDISEKKEYQKELEYKKEELSASNQQLTAYNEEIMAMNEELEGSFLELEKLNNRFEKMIALVSDIENLNTISENEFLSKILKQAVAIIPEADAGSIYTFGEEYVEFVDCIGYDLEQLKENEIKKEAFYNQSLPIEILDVAELKERNRNYMLKDDYNSLKEASLNQIKEIMYLDLELNKVKKAGISLDIEKGSSKSFTHNSKKLFTAFYNIASSFYKLKEYNQLQNNFTREIISSTVKMLEMYDLYTRGHSENVADLAVKIASEMELDNKVLDDIYWAGLVHDIGKMLIPIEILNKEGSLTKEEYEVIKEHPVLGSNALSGSDSLQHIAKYVRHHHERWDGKGYPAGLEKSEIPLISQILCVADAWDAMRSKRTYRDSLTFERAKSEIKINKGKQFAPDVAEALISIVAD